MENNPEVTVRGGARPKRVKHPPAWLKGFEVDYTGHCHQTTPPQQDATPNQGLTEGVHPAHNATVTGDATTPLNNQPQAPAATSLVQSEAVRSVTTQPAPEPPTERTHEERQRGHRLLLQNLLGTDGASSESLERRI